MTDLSRPSATVPSLQEALRRLLGSGRARLAIVAGGYVLLIVLRQVVRAFGVSLGYLYVLFISLSGFWFGRVGGLVAAATASAIFVAEVTMLTGFPGREEVLGGLFARIVVYVLAGLTLGHLSESARKKGEELQRSNDMKNRCLGIAAHDLRDPIHRIQTAALLLRRREGEGWAARRGLLEIIERASEFAGRLIDDILDVSAIESGHLSLRPQEEDLLAVIRDTIALCEMVGEDRRVRVRIDSEGDIPRVLVDRDRIRQVIGNLVGNAVRFSPDGALVTIRVVQSDGGVLTQVVDQGPGIPDEELPDVFGEFSRTSTKAYGDQRSTGLGLAIVKKIVERHGGTVHVESRLGQGSIFSFTIPVSRGATPE